MAVSDDDGTAERLAQVRAQRRHLGRLRTGERRDRAYERAADAVAEHRAEVGHDPLAITPQGSADTRTLLIAEQVALELDRASRVAGESTLAVGVAWHFSLPPRRVRC